MCEYRNTPISASKQITASASPPAFWSIRRCRHRYWHRLIAAGDSGSGAPARGESMPPRPYAWLPRLTRQQTRQLRPHCNWCCAWASSCVRLGLPHEGDASCHCAPGWEADRVFTTAPNSRRTENGRSIRCRCVHVMAEHTAPYVGVIAPMARPFAAVPVGVANTNASMFETINSRLGATDEAHQTCGCRIRRCATLRIQVCPDHCPDEKSRRNGRRRHRRRGQALPRLAASPDIKGVAGFIRQTRSGNSCNPLWAVLLARSACCGTEGNCGRLSK